MAQLTNEQRQEMGRANFEAYAQRRGGLAYNGETLPEWDDLGPDIREGWVDGAMAVRYLVRTQSILRAGE